MKKLFLRVATVLAFAMPSFAQSSTQTSATVLVIRQSNTGVLTIQQAPTPASYTTAGSVPGAVLGNDFADLTSSDGSIPAANLPQDWFWTQFEQPLLKYPGQSLFLNSHGYMMVIWQNATNITVLVVAHDDPTLTGPYVAFTSSLSTAENAIRDKLYTGL